MSQFEVGDECEMWGVPCVVVEVDNGEEYPIVVKSDDVLLDTFTKDGRHLYWHKEPSLKLIKKKPKKVKLYKWAYKDYRDYWVDTVQFYESEDTFKSKYPTIEKFKRLDYTATEFEVE